MVKEGKLSSTNAKVLFNTMIEVDFTDVENVEKFAEEKGLIQMSNSGEIEAFVDMVIMDNPKPAEDIKNGEMKAIGFLVGQVMKASAGKANPAEVQKILKSKLGV